MSFMHFLKQPLTLNLQFFSDDKGGAGAGTGGETKALIEKLSTDVSKASIELKGLMDAQADEIRKHGETSSTTAAQVKQAEEKLLKLEGDMKGITAAMDEIKKQQGRPDYTAGGEMKSVGERFLESDSYKNAVAQGLKSTSSFEVKSFYKKDIDSAPANGGLLSSTYVYPQIVADPNKQLKLRDMLNVQTTNSASIEYLEESGFVNAAATIAEKVIAPQSDITFEQKTAAVRTIAHFIPATQNILDDAPMLRNYIDNRLTYGLQLTEEAQILFGSGTNEDLLGLMTHTGTQNIGGMATGVTRIDHIRRAITRSRVAGYPVNSIVLHPEDWEAIEIAKGTDGHYIFTSVNDGGQMRIFRVPVIESTSMTVGSFLTGSLGYACQLLDREQSNVRVSDSHADYFTRRMVAIMASERLAMPIYRPEALVKGSFGAAV
jgi:HK97 family phage major capsid protein